MKPIIGTTLMLVASLAAGPASAWSSANRYGGSTTHVAGVGTEHTNAYGGSSAHSWYGGTTHTNAAGGTTTGAYGAGAVHTTPYGASTYHPPTAAYPAAYHPPYPAYAPYHPPVAVPYYASGCYNCAGVAAAGAVVGMAAGAAVASANSAAAASNAYAAGAATAAANTTNAYNAGVVAGATVAGSANTANAYNAGVAAGAAGSAAPLPPAGTSYIVGAAYAALPTGSISINKNGATYYLSGNTWFQPAYGANGVHYTVVPTP